MKLKILTSLFLIAIALNSVSVSVNAQISEYPQITEQTCNSCTPCKEGLECINFIGIGSRCAESNPCNYFKCPLNTECIFSGPPEMAIYCPDGNFGGGIANVKCQCVGPECPDSSDATQTVSYDVLTQTVVKVIKDDQTVSKKVTVWRTTPQNTGGVQTTPEHRGILETPVASAQYVGQIGIEESKMFMATSVGKKPINILPEDAVGISETPNMASAKVVLKEKFQKPVYSVKGERQANLLFVIPVKMEVETEVDAEIGNVISISKPWWSFLAW